MIYNFLAEGISDEAFIEATSEEEAWGKLLVVEQKEDPLFTMKETKMNWYLDGSSDMFFLYTGG